MSPRPRLRSLVVLGALSLAFLASDEASYVTGVVVPVDGGISL